MKMEKKKKRNAGKSDTRNRQGGDTVPVPPRSGASREPCYGLSVPLKASGAEESAIAEEKTRAEEEYRQQLKKERLKNPRVHPHMEQLIDADVRDMLGEESVSPSEMEQDTDYDEYLYQEPILKLRQPTKEEKDTVHKMLNEINEEILGSENADPAGHIFGLLEGLVATLTNPDGNRKNDEREAVLCSLQIWTIVHAIWKRLQELGRQFEEQGLVVPPPKDVKSTGMMAIPMMIDKETQVKLGPTITKVEVKNTTPEEKKEDPKTNKLLEEILARVSKLEKRYHEERMEVSPCGPTMDKKKEDPYSWSTVVKKKKTVKAKVDEDPKTMKTRQTKAPEKKKKNRGAGVIVELQGGGLTDYEDIIKTCEAQISLEEMEIPPVSMRKIRSGGIIFEIKDEDEDTKADKLLNKLKEVLKSRRGIKVWRPSRLQRIKLTGLPIGATTEAVARAISRTGGGEPGSVRVGPVRTGMSGRGVTWADCPANIARRVVGAAVTTGLTMGLARVGVSLTERGTPQCYRCLARGHLGRWCPSVSDRGRCCLRCGEVGHRVEFCGNNPHCPICEERGLRAEHRPGDPSRCRPVPPGAERNERSSRGRRVSPPPTGPMGGLGGGVRGDGGASASGGDLSPPGAEAPSSLDPGEGSGGVGRDSAAGSADPPLRGGLRSRSGDVGPSAPSADMSVEWEEGPERGVKRKGPATKECSVVVAPLPAPRKGAGGDTSATKQKRKG